MFPRRLLLFTRYTGCARPFTVSSSFKLFQLLSSYLTRPTRLSSVSQNANYGRRLFCASATDYTAEELIPSSAMFLRIVDELKAGGVELFLPTNNQAAMGTISEPFRYLIEAGVQPEFLIDTCVKRAAFFSALVKKGAVSIEIIQTLATICHLDYEDSVKIFSCFPDELLAVGATSIQESLEVIINCGVQSGKSLKHAVLSCPAILFARDAKHMGTLADAISGFFSKPQVRRLVTDVPQVLLCSIKEVELKYEYIYFHMCIEAEEFLNCRCWVDMPLEGIMMRHEFLVKTGRYVTPDPKRPQIRKENPSLDVILDTPDTNFANSVAGVSSEEWQVFKELTEKVKSHDESEVPFERIKPSMRKAFERRVKFEKESEPYKFESAAKHR